MSLIGNGELGGLRQTIGRRETEGNEMGIPFCRG
jgi:hypothetical protein